MSEEMLKSNTGTRVLLSSDFNDFYDSALTASDEVKCSGFIYERQLSKSSSRGRALGKLRNLGIKTIELKQVTEFNRFTPALVVYTDPFKHYGQGKHVIGYSEAVSTYPVCLASQFIEESEGISVKFTQVGTRRFRTVYKSKDKYSLDHGKVLDICELERTKSSSIRLPIFSIDYIAIGKTMVATDFNEVQKLEGTGIETILSVDDVASEIMSYFNKIF